MTVKEYFDQVYVINLPKATDKMQRMRQIMIRLGVKYKRVNAIDGRSTRAKMYWTKLKSQYPVDPNSDQLTVPGMACTLSHCSAIKHAIENRKKRILVLEDDVILHRSFEHEFRRVANLPSWKLLYLGASDYNHPECVAHDGFYMPTYALGRFAYGVDCSIFKELLELWEHATQPGDSLLASVIQQKYSGEVFVFNPNIVVANVSHSFIREGRDQETQAAKVGWDMSLYQ